MGSAAGRPRGGVDYPRTYQEFRDWFPDDVACLEYLAGLRWPDGFVCPVCGGDRSWRTAKMLWMCAQCGRKTSVTAGTIFHRSHTPISTWFAAVWFVTSQKNGVSALGLQNALGFGSYETAWAWLHKLRRAMVRPERDLLTGVVEVDETFIGGRSAGKKGGSTDKVPVMVAVERLDSGRLGRARFGVAERQGSTKPPACMIRPGTMRVRAPTLSDNAPAMGATTSGVAVQGRNRSPVTSGESPSANWKNWLVRNAAEKIAADRKNWVVSADVNEIRRNRCSGIIGSDMRDSHQTKTPSSAAPPINPVRLGPLLQPF